MANFPCTYLGERLYDIPFRHVNCGGGTKQEEAYTCAKLIVDFVTRPTCSSSIPGNDKGLPSSPPASKLF